MVTTYPTSLERGRERKWWAGGNKYKLYQFIRRVKHPFPLNFTRFIIIIVYMGKNMRKTRKYLKINL